MWLMPIKEVGRFLGWWVAEVPTRIFAGLKSILLTAEDVLQFGANLRLWLAIEPMFGDYSWKGRVIGFVFRGLRVVATFFVYLTVSVVGVSTAIIWWALPWLIFMMIK